MTTEIVRDIVYVEYETGPQKLDLYMPSGPRDLCPVVVWLSGGGWSGGGKHEFPDPWFVDSGIAIVAIDYRLSGVKIFPAAIEDVQTAICWVRAHASEYRFDASRVGVWGGSAGGHLAALVATSADVKRWTVPAHLADQPRTVQAVCDVNGPTLFSRLADPDLKAKYLYLHGAVSRFLGGPLEERLDLAAEASPATYVHSGCPPFQIFQGTIDDMVPFQEGVILRDALLKAGVEVEFHEMRGEGHSYTRPAIDTMNRQTQEFFVRILKP